MKVFNWFTRSMAQQNFVNTDNTGTPLSKAQKALQHLIENGSITNLDALRYAGTTDGRRLFTSWRRAGYLHPKDHPAAFVWETSPTGAKYKRHFWTGKKV